MGKIKQKWQISDRINFWSAAINSIIAISTIFALYFAYRSMSISEQSLLLTKQAIKDSDSTSKINFKQTEKSVDAAIRLSQYAEANVELSKVAIQQSEANYNKSFKISKKSIEETIRQFKITTTPFIQAGEFKLSEISIGEKIIVNFILKNITNIPIKIISYKGLYHASQKPIDMNLLRNCKELDGGNRYLIKDNDMENYSDVFGLNVNQFDFDLIGKKDIYIFMAREYKYENLVTKEIRYYSFQVKLKRVLGSKIISENTYVDFINNENTNE